MPQRQRHLPGVRGERFFFFAAGGAVRTCSLFGLQSEMLHCARVALDGIDDDEDDDDSGANSAFVSR